MSARRGRGGGGRRRQPRPVPKCDLSADQLMCEAINHLGPMGCTEAAVRSTVEELIQVYGEDDLLHLKADGYRAVADMLFGKQEQEKQQQQEPKANIGAVNQGELELEHDHQRPSTSHTTSPSKHRMDQHLQQPAPHSNLKVNHQGEMEGDHLHPWTAQTTLTVDQHLQQPPPLIDPKLEPFDIVNEIGTVMSSSSRPKKRAKVPEDIKKRSKEKALAAMESHGFNSKQVRRALKYLVKKVGYTWPAVEEDGYNILVYTICYDVRFLNAADKMVRKDPGSTTGHKVGEESGQGSESDMPPAATIDDVVQQEEVVEAASTQITPGHGHNQEVAAASTDKQLVNKTIKVPCKQLDSLPFTADKMVRKDPGSTTGHKVGEESGQGSESDMPPATIDDVVQQEEEEVVEAASTQIAPGHGHNQEVAAASTDKQLVNETIKVPCKRCGDTIYEDNKRIFLGNICNTWQEQAIRNRLIHYGVQVESLTFMPDSKNEGKNRGFAFLQFSCHRDAERALERLKAQDVTFGHPTHTAKVAFAEPIKVPDEEVMAKVTSIYVNGLTPEWDEKRLKDRFQSYGKIMSVKVQPRCGYVNFTTPEEAAACCEAFKKLGKNELTVSLSNPCPKPKAVRGRTFGGVPIQYSGSDFSRPGNNGARSPNFANNSFASPSDFRARDAPVFRGEAGRPVFLYRRQGRGYSPPRMPEPDPGYFEPGPPYVRPRLDHHDQTYVSGPPCVRFDHYYRPPFHGGNCYRGYFGMVSAYSCDQHGPAPASAPAAYQYSGGAFRPNYRGWHY